MSKGIMFERRVERVFKSLEEDATIVTWNASQRDPDTGEPRQIDILLRRIDASEVHVECRNRSATQNVQWIEELIGRQRSLRATSIVAVSASGFTKNAIEKAKIFGITLIKFSALSRENLSFAIDPPAIYLRSLENIKLNFLLSSEELGEVELISEIKDIGFPMPIQELTEIFGKIGSKKEASQHLGVRDFVEFNEVFKPTLGKREVTMAMVGQLEACWVKMELKPFLFRKMKPDQTTVLAEISDGLLSGASVELIVSNKKVLFQLEYMENGEWAEKTYSNQAILEGEALMGKKIFMRFKGRPQAQFSFNYNIKSHLE